MLTRARIAKWMTDVRSQDVHSMMSTLIRRLKQGRFARDAGALMMGSIVSQGIALIISPILTRVYDPGIIGSYTNWNAWTGIISGMATGRYEQGIVLPKTDARGFDLVRLGTALAVIVSGVISIFILTWPQETARITGLEDQPVFVFSISLSGFITALVTLWTYWAIRRRAFTTLGFARGAHAGGSAVFQVLFGLILPFKALGLVVGQMLSQLVTIWLIVRGQGAPEDRAALSVLRLRAVANRYADIPRNMLIAGLINMLTPNVPVFVFNWAFSPAVVGLFALARRVIQTPMSIIGNSVSEVFLQRASELAKTDPYRLRKASIEMVVVLLALGLIPTVVLILFGPPLFGWVFGDKWRDAGAFSQVMAVYLWFQFGFSNLCRLFQVLERQRLNQIWEWGRLILVCLGTTLGALSHSPLAAIVWFTVSMSASYVLLGFMAFYVSNEKCKSSRKPPTD